MNGLRQLTADLWNGRLPLHRTFWEFAILYGFFLALFSTIASLALIAGKHSDALALFFYLFPAPYNIFMVVAVWRSAALYRGPHYWATLARAIVIPWALLATLA